MGVTSKLGNMGVVTTTLEEAVNWGRTGAMWPLLFGLACCAIEMMATQASDYDLSRFGMELNRASPRQSDLMIVAGWCSYKMAHAVRRIWDQMPDPKWCIAMGACASTGKEYCIAGEVQDTCVAGTPAIDETAHVGLGAVLDAPAATPEPAPRTIPSSSVCRIHATA